MISRKKAVVIGAGAAGLFAARALRQKGVRSTIIEKEPYVGGKCNTYTDPARPEIKTEWGAALLAPNYGVVLDVVSEKGIEFEESLATQRSTVGIFQKIDSLSWPSKAYFAAQVGVQLTKFTYAVTQYHHARNHFLPLPQDFELPFAIYAKKYGLEDINLLVKPFVSGFGYGAMDDIPAYCVMEYMGLGTIPAFAAEYILNKSSLIGIKGGFQHLMEKLAEDFNVITSAEVTTIDRSQEGVTVTYKINNGETQVVNADALVLAISPVQWTKLGMKLTEVEQECVAQLSYYRYPVAVCKIDGLSPEHAFVPDALEKEGFGHLALITTRDNRPTPSDGRLCTAYINLPPGNNEFSLEEESIERETLKKELSAQAGVKHVSILDTKIWEDYMPTLPWKQRLTLEKEQMREDTSTLYVGACPVGGFEDVSCVADQATRAVHRYFSNDKAEKSVFSDVRNELNRAYTFFYSIPRVEPVNISDQQLTEDEQIETTLAY